MAERTTDTETQRYAELAVETAEFLDGVAMFGTVAELVEREPDAARYAEDSDLDPDYDVWDVINTEALDCYAVAHIRPGMTDIREIVVILGTGGPHYEFGVDWQGRVSGRAYWGGDSAERVSHDRNTLADVLAESFGGWDQ